MRFWYNITQNFWNTFIQCQCTKIDEVWSTSVHYSALYDINHTVKIPLKTYCFAASTKGIGWVCLNTMIPDTGQSRVAWK